METSTSQIYWTVGVVMIAGAILIVLIRTVPGIANSLTDFMVKLTGSTNSTVTSGDQVAYSQAEAEANK